MPWNNDPDKAFPARHPREPDGLRQDILDEIADHLACAAEREAERQEEENEGAVWDRVLDRFGDPDAIARKLWWDQMWEAVMREWIQTGVMVVVTIAVLAGLAMMTRLVAGVGTANDAMREAMKQVAVSNENLAKAMAEQRAGNEAMLKALSGIQGGGGEKPDALELSNIEIVVRRGTPEGPPAPEVKVQLDGQELSVKGEFDKSGRAAFGPLIQGIYNFTFEDPRSQMSSSKAVTLFAGKGAGEYVIVAPDVEPRPVHIDFGLSQYGQDANQLVKARLYGVWEYGETTWERQADVFVGHSGTRWADSVTAKPLPVRPRSSDQEQAQAQAPTWSMDSLEFCQLPGKISASRFEIYARDAAGNWANAGYEGYVDAWASEAEDEAGLHLTGTLPDEVAVAYGQHARFFMNAKHVKGEENSSWLAATAAMLADSTVLELNSFPELRAGKWRDGRMYALDPNREQRGNITTAASNYGVQAALALALPEIPLTASSKENNIYLGLMLIEYGKKNVEVRVGSARLRAADDVFGNVLSAYALHGDWRSPEWHEWNPGALDAGVALTADAKPFWQVSSEALKEMLYDGKLLIPISKEQFASSEQPVTGVLLRWEESSDNFVWDARVDLDGVETQYRPCLLVAAPIATATEQPDGKALTDIDGGRFHYDKEVFTEPLTPQEPNLQPAP
ncbi:MAG: hypothetical protein JNK74_19570 [Candidatus Hydrogenedentes bacterium]|nr:hypothetical protein [Candidatus Hydrogenedentota bacterium]